MSIEYLDAQQIIAYSIFIILSTQEKKQITKIRKKDKDNLLVVMSYDHLDQSSEEVECQLVIEYNM